LVQGAPKSPFPGSGLTGHGAVWWLPVAPFLQSGWFVDPLTHNFCATGAVRLYNPLTFFLRSGPRRLGLGVEERPDIPRAISPREEPQPRQTDRREQRSDLQLAVTVYGFATTGKLFVEHCATRNVSHSGCCIYLRTRPQADSALALRLLRWGIAAKGAQQLLFQVAWVRQEKDGWLVGASALGPADLYSLAFPGTP